ncbi:hypothetical protein H5P28_00825 [Ruficoccus amylovorans]|uniref:Uncharacterized protein n=1 Tax=Ruficoccus amylovorans TaxID=1804625 RepID=A0A842HB38_9BACT|nr:hypothetical protein [Ruficoccus amylovorans]MBC2592794.1 hypothetical protein [Ruficoccus amylovorans]
MERETTCPPPPILHKFGKRCYLEPLLKNGVVSFAVATSYNDSALTEGQQDNETTRVFSLAPGVDFSFHFKGRDGDDLKYYIWCSSLDYSEDLLTEFDADSCLIITDPGQFGDRLLTEVRRQFPTNEAGIPGCDFYARDVKYYDENRPPVTSKQEHLIYMKKNRYSHQAEFRFVFATDPKRTLPDRIEIKIGSIEDIAAFYVPE